MGKKERGERKDRIAFLESSIPERTGLGRGEAYLGKVRPRPRDCARRTRLFHTRQTGEAGSPN